MAMDAQGVWSLNSAATAAMVNGGGFNLNNANLIANWSATSANTSAPVLSTASATLAGNDGTAIYFVKSGTNTIPGRYPGNGTSGGNVTLNAAIGAGLIANPITGVFDTPNTSAGIATVATPSSMTIGVDYSEATAADVTAADFTAVGASTTISSATATIKATYPGNFIHQTTTGTGAHGLAQWFEIVSVPGSTSAVLDRTPNDGTTSVACTCNIGGALDMSGGALGTTWGTQLVAGQTIWQKGSGTYTLSAAFSMGGAGGTTAAPTMWRTYKTQRGDVCIGTDRPVIACGANTLSMGGFQIMDGISMTVSSAAGLTMAASCFLKNSKVLNTSTTAGRVAITMATDTVINNCEVICQNGTGLNQGAQRGFLASCYIHDCSSGFVLGTFGAAVINCVFESCTVNSILLNGTTAVCQTIINCTFYGSQAKIGSGISINVTTGFSHIFNCLFYGLVNGIIQATTQSKSVTGSYNNFFNNTTDTTLYYKDPTDTAVDPVFNSVSQLTGSAASTSGSVLTDATANFSTVTDNVDFLYIFSGTGKTVGKYLITAHTTTTVTLNNAPGTNATTDGVWSVTIGHDLRPTVDLPGGPVTYPGSQTTSNRKIGASQNAFAAAAPFTRIFAG